MILSGFPSSDIIGPPLDASPSGLLNSTLDMSELAPLDPDLVADVLSKHPFITIDGVYNARDLGAIPTADGQHVTRSSFIVRSGELSGATQLGLNPLLTLF